MHKSRQSKITLSGDYDERQIRALLPNFILTQENQMKNSKVKNRNNIEIKNVTISKNDRGEFDVTVDWNEK